MYSILKLLFAFNTAFIVIVGGLLNTVENRMPVYIKQTFYYGKFSYEGKGSWLKPVEVPKSWFRYIYVSASAVSLYCLFITVNVYLLSGSPPMHLLDLLDLLATKERTFTVSTICSLLALVLLTAQCARRLYETWFVSVFSDARMNISHLLVGIIHYFGAVFAILAEAPGFTSLKGVSPLVSRILFSELNLYHLLAIIAFVWAFNQQYKCAVNLANLRKDKSGNVLTKEYRLPVGGLFKWVSSPHMLTEILMYLSLMVLLWGNTTFPYITIWVISNQTEVALQTHWWYQKKFKNLPKRRQALIPFIL